MPLTATDCHRLPLKVDNVAKYILKFTQIHFEIQTNTFKKFRQIYFEIETNTFLNLEKYNLRFRQIHFEIETNTF